MSVLISGIRVGLWEDQENRWQRALDKAGIPPEQVISQQTVKRSVDARKKDRISFIYTIGLEVKDENRVKIGPEVRLHSPCTLETAPGSQPMKNRPVIVGFGPAGMFCGLLLARMGYRPLILERGEPMERRVKSVDEFFREGTLRENSNVQFGEGGAGTFSDGKLTTRINDPRCEYVLRQFVRFGGPQELLWEAKPHVGTDRLRQVVVALREEILRLGGEVRFDTRLEDLTIRDGTVAGIRAGGQELAAENLVLALGHSARDTFSMLQERGVILESKPFSVGVRIEHLQEEIDRGLYGAMAGHPLLPKGEYQLSNRNSQGQAVYTFCMCPGGVVVPAASLEKTVVTNGMSYYLRDGRNANAALVASVDGRDFGDDPMEAMAWQEALERRAWQLTGSYRAPAQTVGRFLEGKPGYDQGKVEPTYALGVEQGDFSRLFPSRVLEQLRLGLRVFGRRLPGFDAPDSFLTGPETRTSSPVRIPRDESCQAVGIRGLWPCGEGGGYAGGIMSAAVDGIRVAQELIRNYKPFA